MRQSGKTILVVGANGVVGRAVVELALAVARVARVVAPTRRALPERAGLVNPVVDFEALPEDAGWWAADAIVGTLGTTLKRAGSRGVFRRVDFDYALAAARLARQHGTPTGAALACSRANTNIHQPSDSSKPPDQKINRSKNRLCGPQLDHLVFVEGLVEK